MKEALQNMFKKLQNLILLLKIITDNTTLK